MEGNDANHPARDGYRPAPSGMGLGEPEVVLTTELAAVIEMFKKEWYRSRSKEESMAVKAYKANRKIFGVPVKEIIPDADKSVAPLGPYQYLEHKTGLVQRAFWRITSGEAEYTNLSIADKLLQAMNLTHLFHNGIINVIPNPRWSQEKYIAYMEERGCI